MILKWRPAKSTIMERKGRTEIRAAKWRRRASFRWVRDILSSGREDSHQKQIIVGKHSQWSLSVRKMKDQTTSNKKERGEGRIYRCEL